MTVFNYQQLESKLPECLQQDGIFRFLRGKDTNLQSLRECSISLDNIRVPVPSPSTDQEQGNREENMIQHLAVSMTIQNVTEEFKDIVGRLLITTKRAFFIANNERDIDKDLSIDAQCISLHAMMTEPDVSVYCQLADENECDEDYVGPVEIIFKPLIVTTDDGTNIEDEKKRLSSLIFESLTKLINFNPVEDADGNDGAAGGLASMLAMMGNSDDDNDDVDMICRIDPNEVIAADDVQKKEEALKSNERTRMLDHLDNLLVVPPEYEIPEDQFDDADDEDIISGQFDDADEDISGDQECNNTKQDVDDCL
jgi:hypothetical protein